MNWLMRLKKTQIWIREEPWAGPHLGRHVADAMSDRIRVLESQNAALREALSKPQLVTYDPVSDTLTINGKRYSASLFGEDGFIAPVGTMLEIVNGPDGVVTCRIIDEA